MHGSVKDLLRAHTYAQQHCIITVPTCVPGQCSSQAQVDLVSMGCMHTVQISLASKVQQCNVETGKEVHDQQQ